MGHIHPANYVHYTFIRLAVIDLPHLALIS
jgi:hypothetical protein